MFRVNLMHETIRGGTDFMTGRVFGLCEGVRENFKGSKVLKHGVGWQSHRVHIVAYE